MLEKIHRLSIPDTMTNVCNGGIDCSSSITKARGEDQKEFESHSIKHKLSEVNNIHQHFIFKNKPCFKNKTTHFSFQAYTVKKN